jgi:hypothetical protein
VTGHGWSRGASGRSRNRKRLHEQIDLAIAQAVIEHRLSDLRELVRAALTCG